MGLFCNQDNWAIPPIPKVRTLHDPWHTPVGIATGNGRRQFEDSLCDCRFCFPDLQRSINALNAITGWDFSKEDAMEVGRRIINHLRVFNFRHELTKDVEAPSARYGSIPVDGPGEGVDPMRHWDFMRSLYYQLMGWDSKTGKPLPETLQRLGLEHLITEPRSHQFGTVIGSSVSLAVKTEWT